MKKKPKIYKLKKLNLEIKRKIISLIKEENPESIISKLSQNNIFKYLDIVSNSNKLDLLVVNYKSNLVGYAIVAKQPSYLFSEFYLLKFKIFLNLLINFNFLTILNIIISIIKIDMIFINKIDKKLIKNNYNLNLLAIKKKFQSRGIGKLFLTEILKKIKVTKKISYLTCETYDSRALDFYIKKCNFKKIGIKIRFFKNLHVLKKKIN